MFLFSPLATGYLAMFVIFLIYWAATAHVCALISGSGLDTYVTPATNSKFLSALAIAVTLTALETGYLDSIKSMVGL